MSQPDRQYSVYILRCADGAYYVGSTRDVTARVSAHNAGHGPGFTACRRPVVLAYAESFDSRDEARRREVQIKKWSRAKKAALIEGNLEKLRSLAHRSVR